MEKNKGREVAIVAASLFGALTIVYGALAALVIGILLLLGVM